MQDKLESIIQQFLPQALISIDKSQCFELFRQLQESQKPLWLALTEIEKFILNFAGSYEALQYKKIKDNVWIGQGVKIDNNVIIEGPCIIGHGTEIRSSCYIRKNVVIGKNVVLGNSCEFKNAILCDAVQTPHYNYIGDSILGYKAHFGAGAVTSNVKLDHHLISVSCGDFSLDTGLRKFGAMVGDNVEVGCNSVLNPGSIIGQRARIYPLSSVRGIVEADTIYKNNKEIYRKEEY